MSMSVLLFAAETRASRAAKMAAGNGPTLEFMVAASSLSGCLEWIASNTMVYAISVRQIFRRRCRVGRSPSGLSLDIALQPLKQLAACSSGLRSERCEQVPGDLRERSGR